MSTPPTCIFQTAGLCINGTGATAPGGNTACSSCSMVHPGIMQKLVDDKQNVDTAIRDQLKEFLRGFANTTLAYGIERNGDFKHTCPSRQVRFSPASKPYSCAERFTREMKEARLRFYDEERAAVLCDGTEHPDKICYECMEAVTNVGTPALKSCFRPGDEMRHLTEEVLRDAGK